MTTFSYEAKTLAGEELKGSREAHDKFELARSLRQEGYTLIKATEERSRFSFQLPSIFIRVPIAEKMIFARNLSVMVAAGLSLARGLEVLAAQTANRTFKDALLDLSASIRKGESFAQALDKHPRIFPELFRAMVRMGEKTGKLEGALKLISHQLKRDYNLRRRIRGALMYPTIIILAMAGVGILMLIYVVPTLVSTFQELNVPLPLSTQFIIGFSSFFVNHFIIFSFSVLALVIIIVMLLRSSRGRRIFDALFLKIPVLSELIRKSNSARTARTLGSLVGSGVEILESLRITEGVLQNHYYKEVLRGARKDIEKGGAISKIFIKNQHLYPLLVGEMIAVGEETGKLSEMLFRLAVFYEGEVAASTKDLSTIIEPVLMIIIGVVVGFFAISMIQPLYSVVGTF